MAKKKRDDSAPATTRRKKPILDASGERPSIPPQREPVNPFHESDPIRLRAVPSVEYEGPDLTGFCLDLDDPAHVFVGGVSGRLDLGTALAILEAAVEDARELVLEPLESGDPARLVGAV